MAKRRTDMGKDAFISAAEKLITEQGANDFLWRILSKEMGISKGTLYYHYPTKDDLILDIMEKHMNELSKDYIDWFARHQKDSITPAALSSMSSSIKASNSSINRKLHIYLINECMRGNESLRKRYTELWESWQDKLQEGSRKIFPKRRDCKAYAYMLMLLIDGFTVQEALDQ
jgi:AcrR family transcriptional regulator